MTTKSSEVVELKGPNRDGGKLISFAIKGDLAYRVVTHIESGDEALVVTVPRTVAAKIGYDLVKQIEDEDFARARTRVKED